VIGKTLGPYEILSLLGKGPHEHLAVDIAARYHTP